MAWEIAGQLLDQARSRWAVAWGLLERWIDKEDAEKGESAAIIVSSSLGGGSSLE